MDIPGLTGTEDPRLLEKAEQEAERLREDLKKSVQSETRDIGTLRKEMRVTVPAQVIADHLAFNFDELRSDAFVPGFRKGRAPLQLVQKRYGAEVRESLKTTVVGQSFFAAVENQKLEVLGDPLFRIESGGGVKLVDLGQALEHLSLPDTGDFVYTCEMEVKPTFELPELKGIEIKNPQIDLADKQVDDYIARQRKIRGRYEPSQEGATESDDMVIADVTITVDGAVIKQEDNVQLGVRPTRLDGIPLMTLDETLRGAKPGDQRTTECSIPEDYERADLRGKTGRFDFTIHEVKRLVPSTVESLIQQMGAQDEAELRQFVKENMEAERDQLIRRAKKEQVLEYLLKNAPMELPTDLSARQTDRAVMRRVIELQQRGVPMSEIESHIDDLRTSAKEEVARDLRLEFILFKVAEKLDIGITDEEVNTEIARMARLYNRRFDRVRDDLEKRGLLTQLAEQIRQDKCIELLLADAKEVPVTADEQK